MGFLKKLGMVLLKVTQIVTGVGPILGGKAETTGAKVVDSLSKIGELVTIVEAIGQAGGTPMLGAEKLQRVTPLVAQAILQSSLIAGKKISDPAKFQAGAQQVAAGIADILNSLEDKVETSNP